MNFVEALQKLKSAERVSHISKHIIIVPVKDKNSYEIHIRPTLKCNLRCKYCFYTMDTDCDLSEINQLLHVCKEKKIHLKRIVITGGEPTIYPKFFSILNAVTSVKSDTVQIQTNATLFSINSFREKMPKYPFTFLVSLPSHIEEVYNELTNSSLYKQAIQGMRYLGSEYTMGINIVLNSKNVKHLPEQVSFIAEQFRTERIYISSLNARHESDILVKYTDAIPYLKKMLEVGTLNNIPLRVIGNNECGFPECILKQINYAPANRDVNMRADQFVKSESCKDCLSNTLCPGLNKFYAEQFGTSELNPIN